MASRQSTGARIAIVVSRSRTLHVWMAQAERQMNARVYTTYSARARVTQRQTLCQCSPKDSGRHSDFSPSLQQCSTTNAYYRLRVLDAGPGVAEEELPRLFTPFFAPPPPRQKTDMGWGSLSHAASSSCMAVRCRLPIAAVAASVSRSNFRYVKIAQRRDAYPLARNR